MNDKPDTIESDDDFDAAYDEFVGSDDQTTNESEDVAEGAATDAETDDLVTCGKARCSMGLYLEQPAG